MTIKKVAGIGLIGAAILLLIFALVSTFRSINQTKGNSPVSALIKSVADNEHSKAENEQLLSNQEVTLANKNCPTGFILVPGDPTYKTADFCVMKYDAKCANKTDLTTGLQPISGACTGDGHGTYRNSGKGCACVGDKQVVSTKSGFPLAYLPESPSSANHQTLDNAKAYCQGIGGHLITNPEWMTIARNVEKVPANWCDKNGTNCGATPGAPGKILANGHNDGHNERLAGVTTNAALIASDDNQPCYGTTTDGSNQCGGVSSQKRTLTLSNNQVMWDLAGNVWSWVDATVLRKDQPQSTTAGLPEHGWSWSEFNVGGLKDTIITSNGKGPALGYDSFRPSNPAWTATQGVGRIYHYSKPNDTDTTAYTFIRGGTFQHGYDSGAFSIHLSPTADKTQINDVGFRCVTNPS